MKKQQSTELVKQDEVKGAAALALPDYLQKYGNEGLEQIRQSDMVLPRLSIAQSGSPAFKKASPTRIEGLDEGDLYNTLTRVVYGDRLEVVPLISYKQYIKFRSMADGGGVIGMRNDANGIKPEELAFGENGEKPVWTELFNFLCWLPKTNELIVVSMKSTAAKVAKNWNSLMRLFGGGGPAFSRKYAIRTVPQSNSKGDFFNFQVDPLLFVGQEDAEKFHNMTEEFRGKEIKMDTSDLDHEEAAKEEAPF